MLIGRAIAWRKKPKPRKPPGEQEDKRQSERFIETARKLLTEKDGEREFTRAVNVILGKPAKAGPASAGGDMGNVVSAAFSEEHTSRLTGISQAQLRYWDRKNFYRPSYGDGGGSRSAFNRIYSFRDIVSLRVLDVLRNQFSVSLQHLREVSDKLSHMAEDRWIGTQLWVVKKKVVWQEPDTDRPQEVLSGQYIVPVILEKVVADTRNDVAKLNVRDEAVEGRVERSRFINHNAPVIAGTRITVLAIQRFAQAGYNTQQIIKEYPDLTVKDVEAALAYDLRAAA